MLFLILHSNEKEIRKKYLTLNLNLNKIKYISHKQIGKSARLFKMFKYGKIKTFIVYY